MTDHSEPLAPPGDVPPPEPAPKRRWLWISTLAVLIVLVCSIVGTVVHVPYISEGPGPASNVLDLISARGVPDDRSKGEFLITTANQSVGALNIWGYMHALISPSIQLVKLETVGRNECVSDAEASAENTKDMEQSKLSAEFVAFRALKMPVTQQIGAKVFAVVEGSPAEGKLQKGDLITAVDGKRATTVERVSVLMRARAIGAPVHLTVVRGARTMAVTVRTRASSTSTKCGAAYPIVGIRIGTGLKLPRNIEIDSQNIGGPSGGLVFTLSLIDVLMKEDLTRGHIIAVTGTIEPNADGTANVGLVGAVPLKVGSALSAHADLFIVPAAEVAEARTIAPKSLRIVGVKTLAEALAVLRALPVLK